MRVINYCDGDGPQLETIISEEGIAAHSQSKITANKHNSARTGAEQAKDLDRQFIIGKRLNNKNHSRAHTIEPTYTQEET